MAVTARSPVLAVLAVAALSCGICPSSPSVTSLSPSSGTAGASQFQLTVNGNDFRQGSKVDWNGSSVVTTFVSIHQLLAVIPAADVAQPATVPVSVSNPAQSGTVFVTGETGMASNVSCGGKTSNAVSFTVNP